MLVGTTDLKSLEQDGYLVSSFDVVVSLPLNADVGFVLGRANCAEIYCGADITFSSSHHVACRSMQAMFQDFRTPNYV